MSTVTARVPAKLNLQLAVGPVRADGYHDVATVYHAVSLFDEVTVAAAGRDRMAITGEGADTFPGGWQQPCRPSCRGAGTGNWARLPGHHWPCDPHHRADPGGRRPGRWQRRRGGHPGRV